MTGRVAFTSRKSCHLSGCRCQAVKLSLALVFTETPYQTPNSQLIVVIVHTLHAASTTLSWAATVRMVISSPFVDAMLSSAISSITRRRILVVQLSTVHARPVTNESWFVELSAFGTWLFRHIDPLMGRSRRQWIMANGP